MPDFWFDKISDAARDVKSILNPEGAARGAAAPGVEGHEDQPENARRRMSEQRNERRKRREFVRAQRQKIKSKKQELSRLRKERGPTGQRAEAIERKRRKKRLQQEIFELESELRSGNERQDEEPLTGTLPDFVVIGAMKGGTSYFYHLLTQHPYVEPCAKKELHFFDLLFEQESVEWYRRCFPTPRLDDGRRTITGEATPGYIFDPRVPARMAQVIPQARLIALLRNPVDRTFSHYQQWVRKGRETRSFEEALAAEKAWSSGTGGEGPERENRTDLGRHGYLPRSIYVDQLLRWSEFFPREQQLVLQSEEFFEGPQETLNRAFDFLGLPEWELQAPEPRAKDKYKRNKRNKGTYEQSMDPATRRRLEEFFEPHNQRLYDYLGVDLGW